jgi:hypothetical protein
MGRYEDGRQGAEIVIRVALESCVSELAPRVASSARREKFFYFWQSSRIVEHEASGKRIWEQRGGFAAPHDPK